MSALQMGSMEMIEGLFDDTTMNELDMELKLLEN